MLKTLDITTIKKVASLIAGNYRTSFKWVGIEFEDLREYTLWDDIHDIDWLSSAKTGKLFIKKYEEERELTTLFVIDSGENMVFWSGEKRKLETLAEIFLTLAFSGLKWWDALGALYFADTIEKYIPPKKTRANFSLMINTLPELEKKTWSNVNCAIDWLYATKTKNHLIFFLTDSLETIDIKKMRALSQKNDIIWLHIFDSFENTLKSNLPVKLTDKKSSIIATQDTKKQHQYEQLRTEKLTAFEKQIRACGWDYLRFDEQDNTFKLLFQFFKKRQRRI